MRHAIYQCQRLHEDQGVAYAHAKAGTPAETTAIYDMAGTVEGNRQMTEIMVGFFNSLYGLSGRLE